MGRNSLKKELSTLDMYTENIENSTIKKRIAHLLDWYVRKADIYKNLFYILSVVVIVINAAIPVINQIKFKNYDCIISIISAAASVFTSVITLFTMKDAWFRYRKSAELIKRECMLFAVQSDRCEEKLLYNIEEIISSERNHWERCKFGSDKK